MSNSAFPHLSMAFVRAMDEIGQHGFEKHGANSFHAQVEKKRVIDRHQTSVIMAHAREHTLAYEVGIPHDHFNNLLHQLAAVAFNAMVEAQFAGIVKDHVEANEPTEPPPLPRGEEFILSRTEDGYYVLKAQRGGRLKNMGVTAKTPEEAVMQMRKLLDVVSLIGRSTEELMETVPCR